jgi:tRNA-dihydrouridine synthase A
MCTSLSAIFPAIAQGLEHVDGVMIGRAAYHHPWLLAQAEGYCFVGKGAPPATRSRAEVVEALVPYAEAQLAQGVRLRAIARHVLGLYHGAPGARAWRRMLSDETQLKGAGPELFLRALREVESGELVAASD